MGSTLGYSSQIIELVMSIFLNVNCIELDFKKSLKMVTVNISNSNCFHTTLLRTLTSCKTSNRDVVCFTVISYAVISFLWILSDFCIQQ